MSFRRYRPVFRGRSSRAFGARDFIDVFFIVKKYNYSFAELLKHARIKFGWHTDPIQLGSRLLLAQEVKDFPRMLKNIDHAEWQNFFIEEARKLEPEVME